MRRTCPVPRPGPSWPRSADPKPFTAPRFPDNVEHGSSEAPALPPGGRFFVSAQLAGGVSVEIEIGIGRTARRAYGFDEVAVVPSRRTRDPDDVDITWEIDAFRFELPLAASAMDAAVSPATAVEIGRLGGLAVLNLEGLFTRYEDPEPILDEISALSDEKATRRMQ